MLFTIVFLFYFVAKTDFLSTGCYGCSVENKYDVPHLNQVSLYANFLLLIFILLNLEEPNISHNS